MWIFVFSFRSSTAKIRGGQVNKLIEVQSLELYCDTFEKTDDSMTENTFCANNMGRERLEDDKYSAILAPLDVSVSLSVCMFGIFYSIKEYYLLCYILHLKL